MENPADLTGTLEYTTGEECSSALSKTDMPTRLYNVCGVAYRMTVGTAYIVS